MMLPPGVDGEIAVRGACVTSGYWNDPEANRRAFAAGWLRTGDLGHLDAGGFLFVTGRIKDIINRGGEKIQPREIENALQAHPAVLEAAVFGMPHPTLGEDVGAAVVLRPGAAISERELRRFVAARLAEFKTPRRIFFLDAIPKGVTGKPQRATLAAELDAGAEPVLAPTDALENRLMEIWKRVLNIEDAGLHDDFFRIGGDSFALALMLSEVETEFGVARGLIEEPEFFATPNIATLAAILADSGAPSPGGQSVTPAVVLQPYGQRVPFFCFPGADENPYYFRHLAQSLAPDQPFYVVRDPTPIGQRGAYTVEEAALLYVDIITTARNRGPYVLGGHCYGGIVAFEVARQLAARGEEVRRVILFEVPAPGYPKVLRHWKDYGRQAIRAMRRGSGIGLADVRAHLNVLRPLLFRRAAAIRRRILMRAKLKSVVEPLERVEHPNVQAGRSYLPKELACDVVQFVAADEVHSTLILDDSRLAWREFTRGDFTVRRTPGRATEIFKPPHVRELAVQLRAVLDPVNAAPRRSAP